MREFLSVAKGLADESRLRVLCALKGRELCVCQITELLGLAPSTVSKHMSILHQAHLVDSRKDGRWIYYRLAGEEAPVAAQGALEWVLANLGKSPRVREDARRLKGILRLDPHELCRRQAETAAAERARA